MVKKRKIGLLHTTIRGDEKLLIEAAQKQGVALDIVDIRNEVFDPRNYSRRFDVALERCVSTVKGMEAAIFFENIGISVVNPVSIARICEDKFATSLALFRHKVPTPPFALVFTEEEAKKAIKSLGGFPIVLKPISGSWGRLISRINDMDALEAVIEQKMTLGGPHQQPLYLQKYIEKPGRDIRIHNIGGKIIAAIYRKSDHWITNTARGAQAHPCLIDNKLEKIALLAGHAIGNGILGIDIFETEDEYLVNEVNHTMEFKNVQRVTKVDVAGEIIRYCMTKANHEK